MNSVRFDHVRLATGPRLHYAEQGPRDGEAIVLLHGWPDSWFTFSLVMPLLPADLLVLAVDQRGYGESDKPAAGYGIPDLAADVIAFLDVLEIDRATLVGHSFGSVVARQVAISASPRIDRLALIGTGFANASPVVRDLPAAVRDLSDPIPEAFAREFQASTAHRPVPAAFFDRIVSESLKLPARLWKLLIEGLVAHDDGAMLHKITAPTLLIWGDHDALFSRADQDRFLTECPSATLTVYQDTGHCPNWEAPKRVAADITAFCQ